MLSPTTGTAVYQTPFTITVQVLSEAGGGGGEEGGGGPAPSTTVPIVTRSFEDPGVTVLPEVGQVTISGKYVAIMKTSWQWLDNNGVLQTTQVPPAAGEFTKITKYDAPPNFTEDCTYTIDGEPFVHTVSLGSYSTGRDVLLNLLKEVK